MAKMEDFQAQDGEQLQRTARKLKADHHQVRNILPVGAFP